MDYELEFAKMRNTIAGFLKVISSQKDRIENLGKRLEGLNIPDPQQQLLDRYTASSIRNRNLNETPETIAYAAHLHNIKNIPAMRISECGLLSQSKMHGLSRWEAQHLLDFCELNHVKNIYEHGLDEQRAKEIVPDYDKLKSYLERKEVDGK